MRFIETIAVAGVTSYGIYSYLNFLGFIKTLKVGYDFQKMQSGMIGSKIIAVNKHKIPYRIKRISVNKSPIMMISQIKGNDLRSAISLDGMPEETISLGPAMYDLGKEELKDAYLEIEFVFAGVFSFVRQYKNHQNNGNDLIGSNLGCTKKRTCHCGSKK